MITRNPYVPGKTIFPNSDSTPSLRSQNQHETQGWYIKDSTLKKLWAIFDIQVVL